MYTLIGARSRRNRRSGRWEEVNLTNVQVLTLQVEYGDVWLFITYPSLEGYRSLRFDEVSDWLTQEDAGRTVPQWLTSLGNRTLPFAEENPGFEPTYVQYTQAWHAGYDFKPVERGGYYNPNGSRYEKEDLLVTRDDLDSMTIGQNALFTVNGFFHPLSYNDEQCYIVGGNKSLVLANDNQIGIYSFKRIGQINYLPITDEMITTQGGFSQLKDGVYVTIPETVDMTDKTLLLVIGGYLQVLSKTYTRVGERSYKIELANLMLLERYYESYNKIDLSSLGLTHYDNNPTLVETDELWADETIRAYLTLEQSFFVIVDAPIFFQELIPLDYVGLPGRYIDFETRHLPVVGAYGKMLENHRIQEEGVSLVAAQRSIQYNYDFYNHQWKDSPAVDGGCYPAFPSVEGQAFLRLMGVEK